MSTQMAEGAVIRAKVKVHQVNNTGDQEYVSAFAVYDSDPNSENAQWSKWTPALSVNITINNPGAMGKLKEGDEFFLDWVPVLKEEK